MCRNRGFLRRGPSILRGFTVYCSYIVYQRQHGRHAGRSDQASHSCFRCRICSAVGMKVSPTVPAHPQQNAVKKTSPRVHPCSEQPKERGNPRDQLAKVLHWHLIIGLPSAPLNTGLRCFFSLFLCREPCWKKKKKVNSQYLRNTIIQRREYDDITRSSSMPF